MAPDDALDWLRLQRTLAYHPEAVGRALRDGVSPTRVLALLEPRLARANESRTRAAPGWNTGWEAVDREAVERDRKCLLELGACVLPMGHPDYPDRLAALPDTPPVLLIRGSVRALSAPAVAIVGARAATQSARDQARRLGRELGAVGFTIVSGLARGIDSEAHRGALEGGGRTVAVLACGLDRIYPPEHRDLATEICLGGALVSEMPLGTPPRRELFPLRNRIISGLCQGIIVVEARRRSGSLITVRHALNQGREVWVVPGPSDSPFAEGSNRLLREGARAIRDAADIIEDLGGSLPVRPAAAGVDAASANSESDAEDPDEAPFERISDPGDASVTKRILLALARGPATRDELIARAELDPGRLARALLDLELRGRVVEERDGRFHLCWRAAPDEAAIR